MQTIAPRRHTDARPPHSGTPSAPNVNNQAYRQVRDRVQQRLLAEINPAAGALSNREVRVAVERIFNETLSEKNVPLTRNERAAMLEDIAADILGLGPLERLLNDDSVTEILVNGPRQVYVERRGVLELTPIQFGGDDEVMRIVERIVAPLGRRIDESSPMVDARLADGSRVNVIIPPLALNGPCMSIRKFAKSALSVPDLIRFGTLTHELADFLEACVRARLNIVVAGGTGTGKTTVLNVLSSYIPDKERIVTIEDSAELQIQQPHVVRLEARPANVEGRGAVPLRQLVINALRMRPDRIVVGEVRSGEALDMLQAMNTGHEGSLTTVHSNSARDTLHRVETMVMMAGMELPLRAIREQIAAAFDLVIQLERVLDGSRKVVQVSEVQGMEGDIIVMQDIFRFVQTGVVDGKVVGSFQPMGVRPKFMGRIEAMGIHIAPSIFAPTRTPHPRNRRW